MPRLVIDARPLTARPKGVGRYAYHLCDQLGYRLPSNWEISLLVCHQDLPAFSEKFRGKVILMPLSSDLVAGHITVPMMIKRLKADILLKVNESAGWNYGVPYITVCHDITKLISLAQKSQGMKTTLYRRLINALKNYSEIRGLTLSKSVVCNSEFIRAAIISRYRIDTSKTIVGYCGIDPRFYLSNVINKQEVLQHYGVDSFILTFATGDLRENFQRLPDLVCLMRKSGLDTPLIIAGVNQEEEYFLSLVNRMRYHDLRPGRDYIIESFLPADRFHDLVGLYTSADFYLELSLHEGFGMQLAEAMACGTTCITSKNGALTEVAGDYGVFINDPLDNRDIVETIRMAYQDHLQDRDNSEQIKSTRRFSWDNTSQSIADCLIHSIEK